VKMSPIAPLLPPLTGVVTTVCATQAGATLYIAACTATVAVLIIGLNWPCNLWPPRG
jgi:hypothetical protein